MTSASVSSMRRSQILLDHALVLEDVGGRTVGDFLAGDEDDDAVGKLADHPHGVLDDEDRAARFKFLQDLHHGTDFAGGEPAHRLIEHDELRPHHEPHRKLEAALFEQCETAGYGI